MIVFLVRHAHTANADESCQPAASRHLSAEGRAAARELGRRLRWHDCAPTAIWTSPHVDAVMTAELIAQALDWEGPIECVPALSPDGPALEILAAVASLDASGSVVLVGHEPGLSQVGARLAQRDRFPVLDAAQAARIDDRELRWLFAHDADSPTVEKS